jgi:nucleoside-diphosphate-sugar epimerase
VLHEWGHEVLVVTRGRGFVPDAFRAVQADRKDLAAMRAALAGVQPDVVINFLGYDLADVQIDYDLFKSVVRQYIFISSTTVYARPAPID